jgi:hypothetical protein
VDAVTSVTELDALLEKVGALGFTVHMFRTDQHGPEVLAGVFQHPGCADVFVFASNEYAHAYRLPTGADTDVFAPTRVYWWYGASPVWTLRALLTLPEPGQSSAPDTLIPAAPGLGIPGDRMPVRMRRRAVTRRPTERPGTGDASTVAGGARSRADVPRAAPDVELPVDRDERAQLGSDAATLRSAGHLLAE